MTEMIGQLVRDAGCSQKESLRPGYNQHAGGLAAAGSAIASKPIDAAETAQKSVNPGPFRNRAALYHRMNICGFYVTGADKSSPDAEKLGFALFF